MLNYDFCVKPLKCFKPCYVISGTLLYRTLLYSRIWRFSSSAIFKFCWRSLRNCLGFWGYESDLRVASLHKATLQPQKKDSNTTSIFSSILYGLVSTVQAALINITACSSYPCNSYFEVSIFKTEIQLVLKLLIYFFAMVTKPKFCLCSEHIALNLCI